MVVIRHHNRASAQCASVLVALPLSAISALLEFAQLCRAIVLDDLAFALLGRRTVAKAAKHDPRRQGAGVLGGQLAQWRDEVDAGVLCQLGHHIGVQRAVCCAVRARTSALFLGRLAGSPSNRISSCCSLWSS